LRWLKIATSQRRRRDQRGRSRDAQGREFFDPGGIRRRCCGEFQSAAIAEPAGMTFGHGMLAGRTQSDVPAAVSSQRSPMARRTSPAESIDPEVQIMACTARCGQG